MRREEMIIPKKIKIGSYLLEVLFPHVFKERTDIFGRFDMPCGKIMVTDTNASGDRCTPTHTAVVFFHEIFHAIDLTYCLNKIGTECEKETLMDGLAIGMVQVLQDNFEPLVPKKKVK
jgi:hypothetical protein